MIYFEIVVVLNLSMDRVALLVSAYSETGDVLKVSECNNKFYDSVRAHTRK